MFSNTYIWFKNFVWTGLKSTQDKWIGSNNSTFCAYTLNYDEQHEQASWVAYILTSTHIRGTVNRTNDFREDYKVKTGSASLSDYKGSGYDRGHLAPAGDMKWSSTAMSESFFMSNISPQMAFDARFNGDMKYAFESGEIKVMNTSDNLTISYDVVIDARSAIIM